MKRDKHGNKVRKLEFLLGQALEDGADTVVTLGTRISSSARAAAAAACAQLGLRCVLILGGNETPSANGNLTPLSPNPDDDGDDDQLRQPVACMDYSEFQGHTFLGHRSNVADLYGSRSPVTLRSVAQIEIGPYDQLFENT